MKKIQTLLLAGAVFTMVSCTQRPQPLKGSTPVSVTTYFPSQQTGTQLSVSGMVTAHQTAMLSTRLMGTIERVYVSEGDHVRQGQVLATIKASDLQAKAAQASAMIAEAEAATKDAQKDYQRYQNLHLKNSVSDKELENMALRYTSAKARLKTARQGLNEVRSMMGYAQVRAPFSGVVTKKLADEGSIANPGMPLMVVEQSGELNVTASVPEEYITMMHKGDAVSVEVKSANATFQGRVSEISPSSTMNGGLYQMKVSLHGGDLSRLRAGMFASLRLASQANTEQKAQVTVRKSSVVYRGQLTGVYVVGSDNRAVLHWVRLGKEQGGHVEVISGLKPDDRVIDRPTPNLYNGQRIKQTS